MNKWVYHVISNTHWDREWRYPFQAYRMDLVTMMDRLLSIKKNRSQHAPPLFFIYIFPLTFFNKDIISLYCV